MHAALDDESCKISFWRRVMDENHRANGKPQPWLVIVGDWLAIPAIFFYHVSQFDDIFTFFILLT